ncbi:BglII/BstYI family type II restriction endonuclease [Peribacillus frigoritolerans]|uniref:BglII/BstYI family type II restriction endonuclease n=1 Tax=Peribacillus frigoritolerans TaxID=450367 RepID=UPI001F4FBE70|nr:BglII/BstYI family type II restriction endonuclease [Peribacillus frigoritolerans]MCK2020519.1 hypothetical protein [Peribacillus frigoritolerans]
MNYKLYSHRNALTILQNEPEFRETWAEIQDILHNLTDDRLKNCFKNNFAEKHKSLSSTINRLLKEDFGSIGWTTENPIFQEPKYHGSYWRLDMAKDNISIELAFNHGITIAWNLLKPVLASELNNVQKAIQTKLSVIICATENLKEKGNFDGAVGTYEKFIDHLKPMMNILSVPLLIVGLEAPSSFYLTSE